MTSANTALLFPEEIAVAQPENVRTLALSTLSLHHFRNYTSARIELSPAQVVVLCGHNGAGKTNILEAVSLLTPGRGLRRAKLGELDNVSENNASWTVAAHAAGMQGEVQIGTGRDPQQADEQGDKRIIRIDGKPPRSHTELGRHLAMLWLTPQMEQLFQEGTSAARKFLDRLVYSFDGEHASRVNAYEYAMRERNRLLQQSGQWDSYWLDSLEQTMAEQAAAIAQARLQAIESINHAMSLAGHSFPRAHLSAAGMAEEKLAAGEAAVLVENVLKTYWANARRQDAAAGRTLAGPHRSELKVLHLLKNQPAERCSTGEQKALLLSIILAQARAGAMWRGVVPLLLLDEVAAHLDSIRRLELFEEICQIGAQTWMTGTSAAAFAELGQKAQRFEVDSGRIQPA